MVTLTESTEKVQMDFWDMTCKIVPNKVDKSLALVANTIYLKILDKKLDSRVPVFNLS